MYTSNDPSNTHCVSYIFHKLKCKLALGVLQVETFCVHRTLGEVLPWGKHEYQKLPMGSSYSPEIFQKKMDELYNDLKHVRTYIDDILIISNELET